MPVTASPILGYPIPGATSPDDRLTDIIAIKNALVSIDSEFGQYILDHPTPVKTPTIIPNNTTHVFFRGNNIAVDTTVINPVTITFNTNQIPDGTILDWNISGLSLTLDPNVGTNTGMYSISSGSVAVVYGNAIIELAILPHTRLGPIEHAIVTIGKTTIDEIGVLDPVQYTISLI